MPFVKLPSNPGVYLDDTPLSAEGYFIDADQCRFVRGRAQSIGGWELASEDSFRGYCRGLHAWRDNSAVVYCAIGTHSYVECFSDGQIYDITPIVARGELTNPLDTISGSTTVNVNHIGHGRSDGDRVNLQASAAVGGLTISGDYTVTVTGADDYTITASATATSTVTGGGGVVDYGYYLSIGLQNGIGGAGYGTGTFGTGTWGGSSTSVFYPRTWSTGNWGQNLLASPRGGAIYEWSPLFVQTELVTNGGFTSSLGWTLGSGWQISGGAATASIGASSDLSTTITMNPAAYFLLDFDMTASAGTLTVSVGSTEIVSARSTSGNVKQAFFTGTGALKFSKSAAFAGTVDNVSVKQLINLQVVPNAPNQNTCMIVTPEKIVMVGGTYEIATARFNPMHLRWSDQDTNVTTGAPGNQDWTPSSTNQSRFYTLAEGSRIVAMRNGRNEVLVWTDTALYVGRYVPDGVFVYAFQLVGVNCGAIGPNAVTMLGGVAYWMTPSGDFMRYGGGAPQDLNSTVSRTTFDNLAFVQQDKIYAGTYAKYGEVWWFYPDQRDGVECSRYVMYSTLNGQFNVWAPGTLARTAWLDAAILQYPVATDANGNFFYQEKGDNASGAALTGSLKTAAFNLGEGDNLFQINGLIPDFDDMVGNMTFAVTTYLYPGSAGIEHGPYTISPSTEKVDFVLTGRQAQVQFNWNTAPFFARMGAPLLDVKDTGMGW